MLGAVLTSLTYPRLVFVGLGSFRLWFWMERMEDMCRTTSVSTDAFILLAINYICLLPWHEFNVGLLTVP